MKNKKSDRFGCVLCALPREPVQNSAAKMASATIHLSSARPTSSRLTRFSLVHEPLAHLRREAVSQAPRSSPASAGSNERPAALFINGFALGMGNSPVQTRPGGCCNAPARTLFQSIDMACPSSLAHRSWGFLFGRCFSCVCSPSPHRTAGGPRKLVLGVASAMGNN